MTCQSLQSRGGLPQVRLERAGTRSGSSSRPGCSTTWASWTIGGRPGRRVVHRPRPVQQPDPAGIRLRRLGRSAGRRRRARRRVRRLPGRDAGPAAGLPGAPAGGDGARRRRDFHGNTQTEKTPFVLPDLATFEDKARDLAHALHEFVTIERHVDAGATGSDPARPAGATGADWARPCWSRYCEEDQEPGVAEQNRENERRQRMREEYAAAYRAAHPDAKQFQLHKEAVGGVQTGRRRGCGSGCAWRAATGSTATCDEALALTTLQRGRPAGDVSPLDRGRAAAGGGADGVHADAQADALRHAGRTGADRGDGSDGRAGRSRPSPRSVMKDSRGGELRPPGLRLRGHQPAAGGRQALHARPVPERAGTGSGAAQVVEGLWPAASRTPSTTGWPEERPAARPEAAGRRGKRGSWPGSMRSRRPGALHDFEPSKREFIGGHGRTPVLLVQGPPGTGKSYCTAFALFARLQGAMAGRPGLPGLPLLQDARGHRRAAGERAGGAGEAAGASAGSQPGAVRRATSIARLLDVPLFRVGPAATRRPPA